MAAPKIPYAQEGREAPEAKQVYEQSRKIFGMVPNVVKLLGHSGPAAQGIGSLLNIYFTRLDLSPRIREIAYLTAARCNDCAYCIGHHTLLGKKAGLTDEDISLLGLEGMGSSRFSEADRAVIRFSYETTKNVAASDEAIEALKKNHDLKQVADIAFVVASANFIQRIGKNLGVQLEMQAV